MLLILLLEELALLCESLADLAELLVKVRLRLRVLSLLLLELFLHLIKPLVHLSELLDFEFPFLEDFAIKREEVLWWMREGVAHRSKRLMCVSIHVAFLAAILKSRCAQNSATTQCLFLAGGPIAR